MKRLLVEIAVVLAKYLTDGSSLMMFLFETFWSCVLFGSISACSSFNRIPFHTFKSSFNCKRTSVHLKLRGGDNLKNNNTNSGRPRSIEHAILNNNTIFYFGVGSNMLK